ncbi:mitochondrial distribution and morphology protein 34 [Pseudomassariella vexata]|uniref:Mitochondrial distribution and morphology protein 34 n=1 Tax=Pseudomassariella vexata TaxID=1141098 RepID=A0A1Y2ED95_9PEZI|nr:mitochondrial distribution and morphology protein 34 [Pseudomassariella vexata]ORY69530.1 mitochondrial distribution and morphology protein 34 [Pseudomassariella vexata]
MAFNFNWSPLTADEEFYQRAQDLLTTALNKSPKPPIIVDDILVTEFNLGSVPPELEILEIGDLAEDRFRGIFKMCYSGDAFLTLRTRVQANPLNTYLSAKPAFTSPQPLAAAAGLTIPLSITLSEIKLSAFVILVFSKQKGLTLVFRNDPLESIKVSSTFDSIQFVRDYLQRTIEGQLRTLMMEELPAIIHKLSLRLWCPDQLPREDEAPRESADDEVAVDPFAAPPLDAVDASGHVLDANELSSLSLDGGFELHPLFSQKNLLRLAALNDSHRTLSLFTPGIKSAMFRAWAGPMDRLDAGRSTPLAAQGLLRTHSVLGNSTTYTFTDAGSLDNGQLPSRSSLSSLNSTTMGLSVGAGRHPRTSRKKKTRVVNLRRKTDTASEATSDTGETMSETSSMAGPSSEPINATSIPEEPEDEEPIGSSSKVRFAKGPETELSKRLPLSMDIFTDPVDSVEAVVMSVEEKTKVPTGGQAKALEAGAMTPIRNPFNLDRKRPNGSDTSSVILEQAWIARMAGEIARRVYDEKQRNANFWAERNDAPPPAYEATQ